MKKEGITYAPLPESFEGRASQKGFHFTLLKRTGDIALFEKRKEGHKTANYEVVVVQYQNAYEIAGNLIPAKEALPSNEQWGHYGWAFMDKAKAEAKFAELAA